MPDFNQLARKVADEYGIWRLEEWDHDDATSVINAIAEQLRQVWNARGEADRAAVEASLATQMGGTASGPYVKNLDRALRALDVE